MFSIETEVGKGPSPGTTALTGPPHSRGLKEDTFNHIPAEDVKCYLQIMLFHMIITTKITTQKQRWKKKKKKENCPGHYH